jgi:SAM-dependent methyltransferase
MQPKWSCRVVDLSKLSPAEMARTLGKPEGEVGRAVGEMLNRVNAGVTDATLHRLNLQTGDHVLEIGFANGRLTPSLLARADDVTYVGIDIAQTMVEEARAFNAELVAAGRATFELAAADAIPFPDHSFDKVFAVNVIYFWPEPLRALSEMRRVLRPDGLSIIASVISAPDEPPPPFARAEFGFHRRDRDTLVALHHEAGFGDVRVDEHAESAVFPDGITRKRTYALVLARP